MEFFAFFLQIWSKSTFHESRCEKFETWKYAAHFERRIEEKKLFSSAGPSIVDFWAPDFEKFQNFSRQRKYFWRVGREKVKILSDSPSLVTVALTILFPTVCVRCRLRGRFPKNGRKLRELWAEKHFRRKKPAAERKIARWFRKEKLFFSSGPLFGTFRAKNVNFWSICAPFLQYLATFFPKPGLKSTPNAAVEAGIIFFLQLMMGNPKKFYFFRPTL